VIRVQIAIPIPVNALQTYADGWHMIAQALAKIYTLY